MDSSSSVAVQASGETVTGTGPGLSTLAQIPDRRPKIDQDEVARAFGWKLVGVWLAVLLGAWILFVGAGYGCIRFWLWLVGPVS